MEKTALEDYLFEHIKIDLSRLGVQGYLARQAVVQGNLVLQLKNKFRTYALTEFFYMFHNKNNHLIFLISSLGAKSSEEALALAK